MTLLTERAPEEILDDEAERSRPRGIASRALRGREDDTTWVRPALLVLLASTAIAYIWALGDSGWANSFYSAAVQAGTKSWKAFFFGSSDASNFITVDKPPASLWVMELSARVFGLSSWSILVPQALEGVATVGVLYATVRRWFSPGAALLAGAVMASTPVAVLMFRYNNPDALLVLLLTLAAYATVRALEKASTWWLVAAAAFVGTGFITKMLQAFLVLPAIGIVYLVAAPTPLSRRIKQLLVAGVALLVSAGWWVAAVQLTPAADRPYIGGSQDNSVLNLIFGYNGFGRLSGNESGSVGGAGPAGSRWGPTGLLRLFQSQMGGQISWLLPAALILLVAVFWWTRKAPRTDRTRAALVLFGGWLIVTALVFSYAQGIIHPYYNVALAPAVGAVVGIGAATLWHKRRSLLARLTLAVVLAASAVWSYVLLDRSPTWMPWLKLTVLVVGLVTALLLVLSTRLAPKAVIALGALGVSAAMAGPMAYALDTVATPHSGAIPSAGPAVAGGGFGFGGPPGGAFQFPGRAGRIVGRAGQLPTGTAGRFPRFSRGPGAGGGPRSFAGGAPAGGFPGGFAGPGAGFGGGPGAFAGRGAPAGGGAGFLGSSTPGTALVKVLEHDARRYEWMAATVNSNSAAGYQLATGDPVMAIGGFNGTDPAPTLAQFERYVDEGKIHYFIAGGGGLGSGSGSSAGEITQWVESHYTSQTVDGVTVYDLAR
jgi:4-amino-4-deoxy-L-arabinose transferase-like glycosyltransferase